MGDIVIKANGLGKEYVLKSGKSRSLNESIRGLFHKKEKTNDSSFWALKDINFEIQKGEAVGIIGKNGAGKSTLLKILSRITHPTTGSIHVSGRMASLLEVGTGFHPELSGLENIYLNGTILGMKRQEIKSKLDEIIAFSGVEKFIDTPVKHYSSGMYVRLAFAVAAHLEPEILVIDEVLAVGDAEFQKKCLGKMEDVAHQGRTVIFVSHNMDAMQRLCKESILLEKGKIKTQGTTEKVIKDYLKNNVGLSHYWKKTNPATHSVSLLEASLVNSNNEPTSNFNVIEKIGITFSFQVNDSNLNFTEGINLYNEKKLHVFASLNLQEKEVFKVGKTYTRTVWIPENLLNEGNYTVSIAALVPEPFLLYFNEEEVLSFRVFDLIDGNSARGSYRGHYGGIIRPILKWEN